MNKNEIWISECFLSIQGEGPETGTPTIFVRVFACNMKPPCPWCDSMYAVKKTDDTSQRVPVESVVNTIKSLECLDVTFTGGEPLMYKDQIYSIMKMLSLCDDYKFHFETNGLAKPVLGWEEEFDITYSVSPKFHALTLKENQHLKKECGTYIGMLRFWCTFLKKNMCLKFVYEGPETIEKIKLLRRMLMGLDSGIDIYLMPEGITFDQDKYKECADMCVKYGFKMSSRLHNIIWGSKRGV